MRFWIGRRLLSLALAGASFGLASCSGNLGSGGIGGGLPIAPGAQGYQQPGGPGQAAPVSRQRALEGAVYVTPSLATIPLPAVGGFSLSLELTSPSPGTSPTAAASASPSGSPARNVLQHTSRVVVVAQVTPVASPSPSPSQSPAVVASPTGVPSGSPLPLGSSVPAAVGSAVPKTSPKPTGSGKPGASPNPAASGPKIETKLVAYPDYAPDAPTPAPTGNVQTFTKRKALVRGYVSPSVDVALYGLAAARFTIPTEEQTANRGYTIAIFSAAKKHKPQLIASDTSSTLANGVIASSLATPLTLKKGMGYDIVLYGDELPATPPPVPPNYATPGSNPFVTPTPPGYQPQPGYTGQPYPGQPYPGQTYAPGTTPTPYPGH
jgi:hypothetical protein